MSADEYVPDEDEMIAGLVQLPDEPAGLYRRVRPDEMKRGLARVRRDAARDLVNALCWEGLTGSQHTFLSDYIDTHYPEETPWPCSPPETSR